MRYKKIAAFLIAALLGISIPMEAVAAQSVQPADSEKKVANRIYQSLPSQYQLSKYDVINIAILGFDEDSFKEILIGPDGYVNLPYAGTVKLAGLTVPEATELLTEKLGEYIKIPGMSIMVKQYGERKVYVMGEVGKQGIYSLGSDYMNVFAALSSAGGITKRARPKHIAVVRMVDSSIEMQEIDLDKFMKKQDASQNIALQDGDMIYVPRSNKIDITEDVLPVINSWGLFRSLIK